MTNSDSETEIVHFWKSNDLKVVPHSSYFEFGKWQHIVAVLTPEGERSVYVNSRLVGSDNPGTSHVVQATNAYIGRGNSNEYFEGEIEAPDRRDYRVKGRMGRTH